MLDRLLLVSCICIIVALILYFFYWNRFIAFLIGQTIRVFYWNQEGSSVWVEIGSIHFSLLAGRILVKDFRYHSSNQTIKIVKGQLQWKYWLRRPVTEEDLHFLRGEDHEKQHTHPLSCRIQISLQGFEWFLYNRTAAYDYIVSQMETFTRPVSRTSEHVKPFQKMARRDSTSPYRSSRHSIRVPTIIQNALIYLKRQLPSLDPKDLLPLGLGARKGVIILGNSTTSSLMVTEFESVDGTFGIVQSRSKHDLYKQVISLRFRSVSSRFVQNDDYVDPMSTIGKLLHVRLKQLAPHGKTETYLNYRLFTRLWRQFKLYDLTSLYSMSRREQWAAQQTIASTTRVPKKSKKAIEDDTPIGVDFQTFEYAIERKILECPVLELSYYVDVVGDVPYQMGTNTAHSFDITNDETAPEWGVDLILHGGFIRYGPWADRQRAEFQRAFFPPTYQTAEITPHLRPGDKRVWTSMHVFIEFRDATTLYIPFREASKDWQWDGLTEVPQRPRKREAASVNILVGDSSTIKYTMPIVAGPQGYEPTLEIHLDAISITSSLNDIRLVSAESCRIRCELPSPLKWNDERTWEISVSLRQPLLFLLRDHINMFTDLGRDWASGPPTDWQKFVPMIYIVKFEMYYFDVNLYANDQNIIDKPLIKEENALLVLKGAHMMSNVCIPINVFHAESTKVSFSYEIPECTVNMTLPRWNTYALHSPKEGFTLLKAGFFGIDGHYQFFSEWREDSIEQLKLHITLRDTVYKQVGWSIRYFMVLRDNYLGSFTHFSTLYEYLDKRKRNIPVGDPILLKYRKEKSNMLQVEMSFEAEKGVILMPVRLYESSDKPDHHSVPCIASYFSHIQLQLRLHDFYMEVSLNVDTLRGCVETNDMENITYKRPEQSNARRDIYLVDGIDIVANRLFGPQPRTATYICIWEIHLGQIKTFLSAADAKLLAAAGNFFRLSFTDATNTPATEYQPPIDPDITFYKINISTFETTWRAGHAALFMTCPKGIKFDSNDLGTRYYNKIMSIRIPIISVKILLKKSSERNLWLEAAEFVTDFYLDNYVASRGFLQKVEAQSAFVDEQDQPTGRARKIFGALRHGEEEKPDITHLQNLHLPQTRLPSLPAETVAKKAPKPKRQTHERISSEYAASFSDSDVDEGISEADRDARLAQTRSLTPIPLFKNEDDQAMSSGDESDDADLTESDSSDSDWSDLLDDNADNPCPGNLGSLFSHYSHLTRHYQESHTIAHDLWDGPAFSLIRDHVLLSSNSMRSDHPNSQTDHYSEAPINDNPFNNNKNNSIVLLKFQKRLECRITPLIVPAAIQFEEDIIHAATGPELCVEMLIADYLSGYSSSRKSTPRTTLDFCMPSISLIFLQHIPFDGEQSLFFQKEDMTGLLSTPAATVVTGMTIENTHIRGTIEGNDVEFKANNQRLSLVSYVAKDNRNTQNGQSAPRPGSIFEFCFEELKISYKTLYDLEVSLGNAESKICHNGPEIIAATFLAITKFTLHLSDIARNLKEHSRSVTRTIVHDIIRLSDSKAIIDPLSTIQPSYLVQRGTPHKLRTDTTFRFLYHLRNCIWSLENGDFQPPRSSDYITIDGLSSMLKQRLAILDQDAYNITHVTSFGKLFPGLDEHKRIKAVRVLEVASGGSALIQITRFNVVVLNPLPSGSSGITFIDLQINAYERPTELALIDLKDPASMSQTSLRSKGASRIVKKTSISVSLGEIQVQVYPHLMRFAQRVLRIRRQHRPFSPTTPTPTRELAEASATHLDSLSIVFTLYKLNVRAAAENLVLEIGAKGVQTGSALIFSKTPKKSSNHSVFFNEIYFQARSPTDLSNKNDQDTLASLSFISGKINSVLHRESLFRSDMRLTFSLRGVHFNVPRSALRLYHFVEEWRSDFFPGIEAAAKDLLSELHTPPNKQLSPVPSNISQKVPTLQIHGKIDEIKVTLQVMHGTWLSWYIHDTVAYNNSYDLGTTHSFGLQAGSSALHVISTAHSQDSIPSSGVKLVFPPLSVAGSFDGNRIHTLILVEFLELRVKLSHWDTLLAVQQKFGQDFNDFVNLMQKTRMRKSESASQTQPRDRKSFQIVGFLKMRGFRIGLEGRSSTVFLDCSDIDGGVNNADALSWEIAMSGLALSLANHDDKTTRNHRSAFVIIDFKTYGKGRDSGVDQGKDISVAVAKIHAVMQPSSIGEIGDFIDHLQAEMFDRQEQRAHDMAAFKEKTQKILQTLEVNASSNEEDEKPWLAEYNVNVAIQDVGVAFPLTHSRDLELPYTGSQDSTAIPAFLFSIKSIHFGTRRGESGEATMKGFSFQFISRFRQSIPGDFLADTHQTRNRLVYPEMKAYIRASHSATSRQFWVGADVSGFILDLDSSIPDYIFSLVDVYRKGMERVERISISAPRTPSNMATDTGFSKPLVEKHYKNMQTSNVLASLNFRSGKVRLYSAEALEMFRKRALSNLFLELPDDQVLGLGAEVFNLPVVTVWAEYRATPASKKHSHNDNYLPPILMFRGTVHSSQNTLRPTMLPFLTELVSRIEARMRKVTSPPQPSGLVMSSIPSPTTLLQQDDSSRSASSMQISFSLRIDRSSLELTCQPDVNVVAGLHWDSGGFVVNISPGARKVSFTGSIGGLTVGLKHGFLSEDCVKLDARNLVFSVSFRKTESEIGATLSSISVVLDTEFLGLARFSRLQDILCFKAVWLDRIPIFNHQSSVGVRAPTKSTASLPISVQFPKQDLSTLILVRIRSVKLEIDLGQSISALSLDLRPAVIRTRLTESSHDLSLYVGEVTVAAKGNLSGHARVPNFVFQTVRQLDNTGARHDRRSRMLELRLTSGALVIMFESDHQKLLHYRAEPLEVEIFDDWSKISTSPEDRNRPLQLSFTVKSPEIVAVVTVGTIPKLKAYVNKFKANLDIQREGASRESATFRTTRSPKPDNPLSAVAEAMLYSAKTRFREADTGLSYIIEQHMSLQLNLLRLVVFPRTMNDPELAQFIGKDVQARLDRLVASETFPPKRNLHLFFASMTISKFTQVNHTMILNPSGDLFHKDGHEWLAASLKDATEATIVGLPSMRMRMTSQEEIEGFLTNLAYEFHSEFVRQKGMEAFEDIYITLNVSLYSWLTILRKNLTRELEQVRTSSDWRTVATAGSASSNKQKKRFADTPASTESLKSATLPPQGTTIPSSTSSPRSATSQTSAQLLSPVNPGPFPVPFPSSKTNEGGTEAKSAVITYKPEKRNIERLTMRQLGEATPDVMHPFFMKKAGFNLEDSLPQYVHEYATTPLEEIMDVLLKLYSRQLLSGTQKP